MPKIILYDNLSPEKNLNENLGVANEYATCWHGSKKFFSTDFNENLFLGQFDHADSKSGLILLIRALSGAREQN